MIKEHFASFLSGAGGKNIKQNTYLKRQSITKNCIRETLNISMCPNSSKYSTKGIIKNDPKKQNKNGKLFEEFLLKNPHLSVVNALTICEGDITRVRYTRERTEETIIDFFLCL